jgi:two-component system sensor histidine kinase AgrC
MTHILLLILIMLRYPAILVGAWLWERTSRRFLQVRTGKHAYAVRLMLFFAGMTGPMWVGDENLFFFLMAFIGVFWLCYQGSRPARIVVCVVFYLLLSSIGTILDTALNLLPMDGLDLSDTLNSVVKSLAAALVYLLARRLNPDKKTPELPNRLWWLCAFLSLAPLVVVLSFSLWNSFGRDGMDAGQYRIAYTVLPFVFLSALALLIAIAVLSRHEQLEQSARLAQMRELYYESLQSKETQVRALRHDLRNHLNAVYGLLEQGEPAKAQNYIAELTASPALHGTKRVCENELANAVLTCKLEEMDRLGLTADVLVTLPKTLSIADTDLCSLLGNALDNAMEAAQKAQERRITVRARADRGMLMLRVENHFGEKPVGADGAWATTKQDPEAHGFGVRGMQEIAARYGGTLELTVQDDRFELVACLPLAASTPAGS